MEGSAIRNDPAGGGARKDPAGWARKDPGLALKPTCTDPGQMAASAPVLWTQQARGAGLRGTPPARSAAP